MNILTINLLFSTIVFWVAARIYLLPKLSELRPQTVLLPILLLHSFRHLGLMFLSPGATYAGIPAQFAYPAAFGDLLAAFVEVSARRAHDSPESLYRRVGHAVLSVPPRPDYAGPRRPS